MAIFHHRDQVGDSMELLELNPQVLSMYLRSRGAQCVDLPREAAMRLHNALGEWLYPTGTQVQNPDAAPLTPADIRAMVAGQVAEIMALHQSPQAKYADASGEIPDPCPDCGATWSRDETGDVRNHTGPCQAFKRSFESLADPEPHDVGHPEPAREPLPIRNPFASFVALMTGVREAQAEAARLVSESLAASVRATRQGLDDAREHPEEDAEGQWVRCPCPQTGIKGIQCPRCGHIHHTAAIGCTARVRRVQS